MSNDADDAGPAEALVMHLPRYGLRWNGAQSFVCVEMPDGYWTPWHLAQDLLIAANSEIARMRAALEKIACRTQSADLLWWQIEARKTIERHNDQPSRRLPAPTSDHQPEHRMRAGVGAEALLGDETED